ncbi:molybdate ABC transporter permease subunit [Gorillibacterium sp. sgz500922]|uniref:molybdate ABC transporter permease subunit n=1 Tax=Gorillibacterium sp. sgz500922 TaxID=3446694 RepID=UPI003F67AB7B
MIPDKANWGELWAPIGLSLKISLAASVAVFLLGLWLAWRMRHARFPGKSVVETVFMLPLALPPTVIGFLLLVAMGRRGPAGKLAEHLFHHTLLFTPFSAVVASVVVAFPLVYQSAKTGFEQIDRHLEAAARVNGANERQVFLYVSLPLAWRSLLSGYILGFARSLGEFGATMMVAGNIPKVTQTLPMAIYLAVDQSKTALAWYWTIATLFIAFAMMFLTNRLRGK